MNIQLFNGDCLEEMKKIPDGSVDMILCDLPYGTTNCKWDKVIPFEPLWEQYKRIVKSNGAIVLFSQQPFATDLINSNRKMFHYEWIWEKTKPLGFLLVNKMPLRIHENILVFYQKLPVYNPQKFISGSKSHNYKKRPGNKSDLYTGFGEICYNGTYERFPNDILRFSNFNGSIFGKKNNHFHPTQKPVPLLEYLIRTYTNEGETVLDNTMGSGSTGVACVNTNRNFIGIELDEHYFEIAKERIADAEKKMAESLFKEGV